jgi:hypothetical protein
LTAETSINTAWYRVAAGSQMAVKGLKIRCPKGPFEVDIRNSVPIRRLYVRHLVCTTTKVAVIENRLSDGLSLHDMKNGKLNGK